MALSVKDFFNTQLFLKIPQPTTSFASKTVIITGANSGLGKEAVKHIVTLGATKVILACRSLSKGNEAKFALQRFLKCSPDALEVWELDLESPASVKEFAARANKLDRLDVLINNAGIQTLNFSVVYGTERAVAVNVIGTFLLACLIVPKLMETSARLGVDTHLTFVGSALFNAAKYPRNHGDDIFTYLSEKKNVDMMNQYNLSKLFQILSVIQLASIVDPLTSTKASASNRLIINTLDPCFCKTGLAREISGVLRPVFTLFEFLFARTAEEGSRLVVQTASAGGETHGGYMRSGELKTYPPLITSEGGVRRRKYIWELLEKTLEVSANTDIPLFSLWSEQLSLGEEHDRFETALPTP
ncbi:Short chain dehydrogenase atnD [Hyphodiscus hymeniophilus]|uniref:Short chain dehydrogenase atnD n=1 Tax=Hyphodiscus hymeniophilus TaxID=353542 RepID=A0A9P6VLN7_9HELO|nr:Short chain dehydrogenase atnD [Hyphodiscus hymeniophilus]